MDAAGCQYAETSRKFYDVPIRASDSDNFSGELLKAQCSCLYRLAIKGYSLQR